MAYPTALSRTNFIMINGLGMYTRVMDNALSVQSVELWLIYT